MINCCSKPILKPVYPHFLSSQKSVSGFRSFHSGNKERKSIIGHHHTYLPKSVIFKHQHDWQKGTRNYSNIISSQFSIPFFNNKKPLDHLVLLVCLVVFGYWIYNEKSESLSDKEVQEIADHFGVRLPEKGGFLSFWNEKCQDQLFPLVYQACKEGKWEHVKRLKPLLIKLRNSQGLTLFLAAVKDGDEQLVKAFIKQTMGVLKTDREGNNGLHIAAKEGHAHLAPYLSEALDLDGKNEKRYTPLQVAVFHNQPSVIHSLLNQRASFKTTVQFEGHTFSAMALCIYLGKIKCLDTFLNHPTLKNQKEVIFGEKIENVGNWIHLAACSRTEEAYHYFLKEHFDEIKGLLREINSKGETPLFTACEKGKSSIMRSVISYDRNIFKINDNKERSCAHAAAIGCQLEILKELYEFGVPMDDLDMDGKRPFDHVKDRISEEAISCANFLRNISREDRNRHCLPIDYCLSPPQTLLLESDGLEWMSLSGAMEGMCANGLLKEVKRVGGSNGGALIAALYAVGYSPEEIQKEFQNKNFDSFLDFIQLPRNTSGISSFVNQVLWTIFLPPPVIILGQVLSMPPIVDKMMNELADPHLCYGLALRAWIDSRIEQKTGYKDCTFGELHDLIVQKGDKYRELHLFSQENSKHLAARLIHLHSEDEKWKDVIIADAVFAALSVRPFVGKVVWRKNEKGKSYNNEMHEGCTAKEMDQELLPLFDVAPFHPRALPGVRMTNRKTLCIKAENYKQTSDRWFSSLFRSSEKANSSFQLHLEERYVKIHGIEVNPRDLKQIEKKKNELYQVGNEALSQFLAQTCQKETRVEPLSETTTSKT